MFLYLYKADFCLVQQQGQELSSVRRTFQIKGSMHLQQPPAQREKSTVTPSIGQLEIWDRQWNMYLRKYAHLWLDSINILCNRKFHVWIIPSPSSVSFKLSLCFGNSTLNQKLAAERGNLSSPECPQGITCSTQEGTRVSEGPAFTQRDAGAAGILEQVGHELTFPTHLWAQAAHTQIAASVGATKQQQKGFERGWQGGTTPGGGTRAAGQLPFQAHTERCKYF